MILECPKGHRWREELPLPMHMTAAATRFKAMGVCINCAAKKVVMLTGDAYTKANVELGNKNRNWEPFT